jgi:hypothetical protein
MSATLKKLIYKMKMYKDAHQYKLTTPNIVYNSDLYVVEYPKSGITWLTSILANLCYLESGINKKATYYNLEQFIGDVHISRDIAQNDQFPYHRIIKSHAQFNPNYRHVIYLVRNPYSVMSSFYHYCTNNGYFRGEYERFVKSKDFGIDSWVSHVISWIDPKKEMKLHLIKYEDLFDDPQETISLLCQNLGYVISRELIEQAINMSDFSSMKKSNNLYRRFCPTRKYDFVRSGKRSVNVDNDIEKYIYDKCEIVLTSIYPELINDKM